MNIALMKNRAEHNRVDKSSYLEVIDVIQGTLREDTSITDVVITIELETFNNFNYVYIEDLRRYYFVNDIIICSNKLYELHLSIDVLMSYKDAILNLNAFIDRNEKVFNPYIIDKKRVVEQGIDITTASIPNYIFFNSNDDLDLNNDLIYVLNGYKLDSSPLF